MANTLRYKTVKDFADGVDEYFKKCEIEGYAPCLPDLALYLGFSSKSGLANYKFRRGYAEVYEKAVTRCEVKTYRGLFDPKTERGSEFALKYAFGYGRENQEEKKAPVMIVDDIK